MSEPIVTTTQHRKVVQVNQGDFIEVFVSFLEGGSTLEQGHGTNPVTGEVERYLNVNDVQAILYHFQAQADARRGLWRPSPEVPLTFRTRGTKRVQVIDEERGTVETYIRPTLRLLPEGLREYAEEFVKYVDDWQRADLEGAVPGEVFTIDFQRNGDEVPKATAMMLSRNVMALTNGATVAVDEVLIARLVYSPNGRVSKFTEEAQDA